MALLSHYIEFPNLGWKFTIDDVLFQFKLLGNTFTIKWYGVLIAVGFLLAVWYGLRRADQFGVDPDRVIDVAMPTVLLAFVGARLYYVLFCGRLEEYLADPITILQIWKGGIGIYGGIITTFLVGPLMCKLFKVDTLGMFDLASLGFLIGQGIGRWGNFFNQEAFGGNTDLPWAMTGDIIQSGLNGSGYDTSLPVHPTFLYESLWCLLGFVLLHILSKKAYHVKGQIFCGYMVWYGCGRFLIESLRTDSLMTGTMKTSQLVAVLAVALGVGMYLFLRRRQTALPKELMDITPDDQPEPEPETQEETYGNEN